MLDFKHAFCFVVFLFISTVHAVDFSHLADDPYWHLLLHYEKKGQGFQSMADGSGYFLSPVGQTSPLDELRANIQQLMRIPAVENQHTDPRCRFPLRYQWLREQLNRNDLPSHERLDCSDYQAWKKQLGTAAVWLDFASSYTNNPASMFGHTFLRLERKGAMGIYPDLLHYTVNFAAETNEQDGGMLYTIKGLFGGYPGVFSTIPFYQKVQEYNHIESRDVWEYPLALSSAQQDLMVDHLWELGATHFWYYFIDENCSYFLLMLMETVDGKNHFRDGLPFFTVPIDTLRVLKKKTNWVGAPQYRPSLEKKFYQAHQQFSASEKRNWKRWMIDQQPIQQNLYNSQTMVQMLDAGLLYHAWIQHHHAKTPWQKKLLLMRSQHGVASSELKMHQPKDPLQGHLTSRLGVGYRQIKNASYGQLEIRGAYHDLLDQPAGFDPMAQVEMLRAAFRYRLDKPKLRVDRVQILEILSLYPYRSHDKRMSWNVSAGYETLFSAQCMDCAQLFFQAGPGITLAKRYGKRLFMTHLINVKVGVAPWNELGLSVSPQWISILQWDLGQKIRLQTMGEYIYDAMGPLGHQWSAKAQTAWDLNQHHQLRPYYAYASNQHQWGVNWLWYF